MYNCTTLQVRMYSRALAIIGGFLILASGAGEVYRQKARSRSLQSTGQIFLGVYLICMVSVCFGSSLMKTKLKTIQNLDKLDTLALDKRNKTQNT